MIQIVFFSVRAVTDGLGVSDCEIVWAEKCFALVVILIISFVNVMSAKWGAYVQNVCLVAKLFAIVFIVFIGLVELATGTTEYLCKYFKHNQNNYAKRGGNTLNYQVIYQFVPKKSFGSKKGLSAYLNVPDLS